MINERSPFEEIGDFDPFCQGDILHSADGQNAGLGSFAVIITADCDIAQSKDAGEFSLLKTIPAERFIAESWARIETRKLVQRQTTTALDILNGAISRLESRLEKLTPESLAVWMDADSAEDIIRAVGISGKAAQADVLRALRCMAESAPVRDGEVPLEALKRLWALLGTPAKTIKSRMSDALDPNRGSADVYFVPYLPGFNEIGFVVQLRSLLSVRRNDVFASRTDARISDRPDTYYRVGRFRDGVKYSLVHRMVNLFSRVGLSEEYEAESSSAADLVVEQMQARLLEDVK